MPILQVSRKIDYALRAVIHLASEDDSERACSVSEIATRERIPRQFLVKIIQELIHKGLVRSRRGPHGGYVLARPAKDVTFREVIEAVEGPIHLNVCLDPAEGCNLSDDCTMHGVWKAGQERMLEVYRATRLDQMAAPQPARKRVSSPGAIALPVLSH